MPYRIRVRSWKEVVAAVIFILVISVVWDYIRRTEAYRSYRQKTDIKQIWSKITNKKKNDPNH